MPPLVKQPVTVNFAQGLETKQDPNQVPIGKFLALQNSIFDEQGALKKRNGFPIITTLPNALQTTLTTLNDNLLATGSNLYAYSQDTSAWINKGTVQPVQLETISLLRNSTSQVSPDTAIGSNGLACTVYVDNAVAYYQISDSQTGQQIVTRTTLPTTATNPRVFALGRYFIITFMATVSAAAHIQYIAIPFTTPASPNAALDISATVLSLTTGYDGFVANNNLYLAWSGSATTIRIAYLSSTLIVSASTSLAAHTSSLMSVTVDTTASTPVIWLSWWQNASGNAYVAAYNQLLSPVLAATLILAGSSITEITSIAANGVVTVFWENDNIYSFSPNAKTDYLTVVTVTQAGVVGTPTDILRSVGLASKPFFGTDGKIYVIATYGEANQPTYFLIDSTGSIYMRLVYSNGGGYASSQVLPSVSTYNSEYYVPYLIKDFLASVNKGTALPSGTPTSAIYTQTGINLAKFSINAVGQYSTEIASALHLTGGQFWEYDGVKPVEHSFQVWPENMAATTATTGGHVDDGTNYYIFTYEWTDNQGMLHRSAPSIPLKVVTTGGNLSTNTIHVPTLRLTDKIAPNPVRIVGYRYSIAQPVYYQFTSLTSPTVNNPAADSVTITDTLSNASILGNTLLYTTGGVVENIAAPASIASTLYKNRVMLVTAEDPNSIWYSKQVIENTPVEFSDLFTIYVAPTIGAQQSTGPSKAIAAMDDKFIIFKSSAIYYITGSGPDITGANNDFSDPVFITSSVGCANPNSIVLTPNGLMFQSNKGIWLLGRDLSTTYIGSPVEIYNDRIVQSAQNIPGTNQIRFVIDGGITLVYDYYYGQWGTFSNINAISSTLYQGYQTYLNAYGQVLQEAPNTYLDGSQPVLLSFTTSWLSLAGLRGYERFYFMFLLGTYFSPFKLNVQMCYDFNPNPQKTITVIPDNYSAPWGGEANWGSGGRWGGPGNVIQERLFPEKQKCQTFQLIVNEIFDPSFGTVAGAGLTLSGMNFIIGVKKAWPTQSAAKSFG